MADDQLAREGDDAEELHVTVKETVQIDPERVEEWVLANFVDGDQVQVLDSDGNTLYDNLGCDSL